VLCSTDNFKAELNRACAQHVTCISCTTYIPLNRPHRIESTCTVCSRATCASFDPLGCPLNFGQFVLRHFNGAFIFHNHSFFLPYKHFYYFTELGTTTHPIILWNIATRARHFHFNRNTTERDRFLNCLAANNLTPALIAQEIAQSAGYDEEHFFCTECEGSIIEREIAMWWQRKRDSGAVLVPGMQF
jgi:hypothetical protein